MVTVSNAVKDAAMAREEEITLSRRLALIVGGAGLVGLGIVALLDQRSLLLVSAWIVLAGGGWGAVCMWRHNLRICSMISDDPEALLASAGPSLGTSLRMHESSFGPWMKLYLVTAIGLPLAIPPFMPQTIISVGISMPSLLALPFPSWAAGLLWDTFWWKRIGRRKLQEEADVETLRIMHVKDKHWAWYWGWIDGKHRRAGRVSNDEELSMTHEDVTPGICQTFADTSDGKLTEAVYAREEEISRERRYSVLLMLAAGIASCTLFAMNWMTGVLILAFAAVIYFPMIAGASAVYNSGVAQQIAAGPASFVREHSGRILGPRPPYFSLHSPQLWLRDVAILGGVLIGPVIVWLTQPQSAVIAGLGMAVAVLASLALPGLLDPIIWARYGRRRLNDLCGVKAEQLILSAGRRWTWHLGWRDDAT
jgi:hypothetical protein